MLLSSSPRCSHLFFRPSARKPLACHNRAEYRRAFTLTEVVISALIFSMLAAGIFSSAIFVRRQAEASVRESIAVSVSTGFLEQLFATDFPVLIDHLSDRSRDFPFVSRDGEPLDRPRGLMAMDTTDWGDPIEVPLVDRRDAAGNQVPGPQMRLWFIPAVQRSTDTVNDAVDIRIRFRWDSGQSSRNGIFPERTLYVIRTRVST